VKLPVRLSVICFLTDAEAQQSTTQIQKDRTGQDRTGQHNTAKHNTDTEGQDSTTQHNTAQCETRTKESLNYIKNKYQCS
jgi:hypothetical protein